MMEQIDKLRNMIASSRQIVFLGGAGVSTESGIPDFRSADGLYSQQYGRYKPEEVLHRQFFFEHPDLFYAFYFDKIIYTAAKPNAVHICLAQLEREKKLAAVVTQNIDGLHQAAGSQNVIELHGSVYHNTCLKCGAKYGLEYMLTKRSQPYPTCDKCGGMMKPDVILYGEQLSEDVVMRTLQVMKNADMLIIGGTSLTVYPAMAFATRFAGEFLVVINKSGTFIDKRADLTIRENIGAVFQACMDR